MGRSQANVLLEAITIGEDRQRGLATGLAPVKAGVVVLLLTGGFVIFAAGLMSL